MILASRFRGPLGFAICLSRPSLRLTYGGRTMTIL
jgi:hypothetical protein